MPSQVQNAHTLQPRDARQEYTYAALIRGRERVRYVLEPHLGALGAMERANNIAQALVFVDVQPLDVVLEMLRHLPIDLRLTLAEAVTRVWLESAACIDETN